MQVNLKATEVLEIKRSAFQLGSFERLSVVYIFFRFSWSNVNITARPARKKEYLFLHGIPE